jgi:hypothetical protein
MPKRCPGYLHMLDGVVEFLREELLRTPPNVGGGFLIWFVPAARRCGRAGCPCPSGATW